MTILSGTSDNEETTTITTIVVSKVINKRYHAYVLAAALLVGVPFFLPLFMEAPQLTELAPDLYVPLVSLLVFYTTMKRSAGLQHPAEVVIKVVETPRFRKGGLLAKKTSGGAQTKQEGEPNATFFIEEGGVPYSYIIFLVLFG